MIRQVINTGRLALVCLALAMLVVAGPLHLETHSGVGSVAADVAAPQAVSHAQVQDVAGILLALLHGHAGEPADHDHSTPHLAPPSGAEDRDIARSATRGAIPTRAGHGPLTPTPPPRV